MTKIGFIAGNFDLLHYGHINTIRKCASMCDILYVLVNTDKFSKRYKRACIMNEYERIETLKAVFKDKQIERENSFRPTGIGVELNFGEENTTKTIDKILKREEINTEEKNLVFRDKVYIFHGDDWVGDDLKKQMGITEDWLRKNNAEMWYFDRSGDISTSEIIERCKNA